MGRAVHLLSTSVFFSLSGAQRGSSRDLQGGVLLPDPAGGTGWKCCAISADTLEQQVCLPWWVSGTDAAHGVDSNGRSCPVCRTHLPNHPTTCKVVRDTLLLYLCHSFSCTNGSSLTACDMPVRE